MSNAKEKIVEDILDKFAFRQPVPEDIKKIFFKHKKKVLKNILLKLDEYNIIYGLVLNIFFYFSFI